VKTEPRELLIEAGRGERQYWSDLWRYRELFYLLAWRDVLVRYKQTVIGVAWAVIRPLLTIVVFTIVFGKLAQMPSEGVPYPLLVCAGMLPWQFFASAFSEAGNSLVGSAGLVSKVYFPRLIIPTSAIIASLVDLAISLVILAGLMAWYGVVPDARIVALPLFLAVAFGAALGAGVWIAALNVKYRDFRFIVPFIVQFGLYISPVGFSSTVVPESWRMVYAMNPMVGVIDGFRWTLLRGAVPFSWSGITLSLLIVLVLLVSGISYFRKTERRFADVI
jgi:lipopolysaccharide transport system permease protein